MNASTNGENHTVPDDRSSAQDPMVKVENLSKHFPVTEGILDRKVAEVRAVEDISFEIPTGKTFGLVGESGSGKTTVGRTLLRLIEPTQGSVTIRGKNVFELPQRELKSFRKDIQMVYQDPASSLNPRHRVKKIIESPMEIHDYGTPSERVKRTEELLEMVDLPREFMYKYPGQLSGGQKQRVNIARSVALNPDFIVLDEPTSALDVSVQARVVKILNRLQEEFDLTYLFITHDLSLLKNVADRIGVMYLGRLVEVGDTESVYRNPQHPYTRALLSSISTITEEDEAVKPDKISIEGEIPDPREKPSGCAFRSRCPLEFEPCSGDEPSMYQVGDDHISRCFLHDTEENPEGTPWNE